MHNATKFWYFSQLGFTVNREIFMLKIFRVKIFRSLKRPRTTSMLTTINFRRCHRLGKYFNQHHLFTCIIAGFDALGTIIANIGAESRGNMMTSGELSHIFHLVKNEPDEGDDVEKRG